MLISKMLTPKGEFIISDKTAPLAQDILLERRWWNLKCVPEILVNSYHMTPRNNPEAYDFNNRIPSYSILPGISLAFHGVNKCKMLKRTEQETVKN